MLISAVCLCLIISTLITNLTSSSFFIWWRQPRAVQILRRDQPRGYCSKSGGSYGEIHIAKKRESVFYYVHCKVSYGTWTHQRVVFLREMSSRIGVQFDHLPLTLTLMEIVMNSIH